MDDRACLGKRIQELRKSRGLSQEKLAELVGINSKYLGFLEQGRANPTLSVLMECAKALKVELPDFFAYRWLKSTEADLRKKIKVLADKAELDQLREMLALLKERER